MNLSLGPPPTPASQGGLGLVTPGALQHHRHTERAEHCPWPYGMLLFFISATPDLDV